MSLSCDPRSWPMDGRCRALEWSGADPCWSAPLGDGRSVRLGSSGSKFEINVELPAAMRGARPEELLAWQFDGPAVACSDPSGAVRLRAGMPVDDLTVEQMTSLLEAAALAPEHTAGRSRVSAATALAVARSIWETEYGQSAIRETSEGLELARALSHTTAPLALAVDAAGCGARLSGLVIPADFIEPGCRGALPRHLLLLNAHTVVGGFALDRDGSVVFSVVIPDEPKRSQVSHALKSIVACCRRFGGQISRLATEPPTAELWTRMNEPSNANQGAD